VPSASLALAASVMLAGAAKTAPLAGDLRLPVYLDEQVQSYLTAKADAKGVDLAELVNDMLKKDIEIIEMAR